MKLKSLMWLLALMSLGAACTDNDPDMPVAGTSRNEVELVFNGGNGESQEYTKAIASDSENKIDKLAVYVFASNVADGTYYFLEKWTEGTAYDPAAPATTNFLKQGSGTSWKASIYPNELHGLPYLKLLCVANQGMAANITDEKFYDADGTEILNPMVPITADLANAAVATTEAVFRDAFSKQMQNADAGTKDIIHTPLLMTGEGSTKISGSVSKVNITLKRIVARFDIDNTSSKSQLTIEKITLAQARKSGSLWGTTLTSYPDDATRATGLMTYADVTFTDFTGANQGTTESALYVYPGLATDLSYLIIQGQYKSPVPGAGQVPVIYHVPIVKTDPVTNTSAPIAITANNRYQLHITDVTQSNIYATFMVEDWTSGGGIQIKPDNDAPLFDPATNAKTGITADADAPVQMAGTKTNFRVVDGSTFKVTVAATGKVRAEMEPALTRTSTDWLSMSSAEYKEEDGIWYTTIPFSVNNAPDKEPIAVHFINETASFDPDLWTTLTFFGPSAAPVLVDGAAHSLGNSIDPAGGTATMYNVVGSYLTVKVWCVDGSTMELPASTKLEQVGEPVTDGFHTSYKIKIKTKLTDGGTETITFKNKLDATKATTLTVTAASIAMTADLADHTGKAEISGTVVDGYTVTTNSTVMTGNATFTLQIHAPQDVIANLPNGKWLKVVKAGFANGVSSYTVSYNAAATDTNNFALTFKNKLDETDVMTVTMHHGDLTPAP